MTVPEPPLNEPKGRYRPRREDPRPQLSRETRLRPTATWGFEVDPADSGAEHAPLAPPLATAITVALAPLSWCSPGSVAPTSLRPPGTACY